MTLPLELGGIQDRAIRTAFEQLAQRFPLTATDLASRAVTPAKLQYPQVFGVVSSTGTITTAGSGDWSASKTATGAYTVTFTAAFTAAPAVALTVVTTGAITMELTAAPGTGSFTTSSFITNTGAAADSAFSFIAIGAR